MQSLASFLSRPAITWILFTALMLFPPSVLFLLVVIMFMPSVFFVAGVIYMIPKLFVSGHTAETLSFMLIFGLHALIYTGIYYVLARLLATGIMKLRSNAGKICAVIMLLIGLGSVTLLPIYGGGGHGPIRWRTLVALLQELSRSYGEISLLMVYAFSIALLGSYLFVMRKKWQNK